MEPGISGTTHGPRWGKLRLHYKTSGHRLDSPGLYLYSADDLSSCPEHKTRDVLEREQEGLNWKKTGTVEISATTESWGISKVYFLIVLHSSFLPEISPQTVSQLRDSR